MNIDRTKPVICKLYTGYKIRKLYAYWDGYDTWELYKDIEETKWVASLKSNTVTYYWTKYSGKPNIKNYKLVLNGITHTKFKIHPVNWSII